ncbi:hypothetical protein PIB30_000315 [Stylosanthes scabra]|uniref:GRF-type domain-containing protein n=1 Tax=Stylosanthes scabra TaxID=79078 RepID=A0ABU6T461_9FABA|nr:hypothetical protein [Stylosanthes scabra]
MLLCLHGVPPVLRVSRTKENPGRRFWDCVYYEVHEHCDFFVWPDLEQAEEEDHEKKVLNEEEYVPSNSERYPLGGIIAAIDNAFHLTPAIECKKYSIKEIHPCFYKDFKSRDCVLQTNNKMVTSSSSCPEYVSLPEVESLEYGNDVLEILKLDASL